MVNWGIEPRTKSQEPRQKKEDSKTKKLIIETVTPLLRQLAERCPSTDGQRGFKHE